MKQAIVVRAEIFREGHLYLGVCLDLSVSSFGETMEDAKSALREAVEAFLEECEAIGTLEEVLEEAGFVRQNGQWMARQPISAEMVTIG
jgi:hypothetical protein